jgi:hypothetical protein
MVVGGTQALEPILKLPNSGLLGRREHVPSLPTEHSAPASPLAPRANRARAAVFDGIHEYGLVVP